MLGAGARRRPRRWPEGPRRRGAPADPAARTAIQEVLGAVVMGASVSPPAGEAEILRLFSGRRHGRRTACEWRIECRGQLRTYVGQAVDVSRVGTLLSLSDRRFC